MKPADDPPSVSVIIPARNAEETISETIDSVLSQRYDGPLEVIVADGSDSPGLSALVRRRYPHQVRLISNPEQTAASGLNAALRVASGEIVVRCDAHTVVPPGYVRRVVQTLKRTGAANVGGRQHPVGTTFFERAVAIAMTTPLGAGGARYRLGGAEGRVDTVFMGAFPQRALKAVGGYDSSLMRNQDYELNWRLRQRGEVVWFDPELAAFYKPRSSLGGLARQYFEYGRWKRVVLTRHPASAKVRQLAAPLLVLALIASTSLDLFVASTPAPAAVPLAYLGVLAVGSLVVGVRRRTWAAVLLPLVLATMHICWGVGFFLPPRQKGAGAKRPTRQAADAPGPPAGSSGPASPSARHHEPDSPA